MSAPFSLEMNEQKGWVAQTRCLWKVNSGPDALVTPFVT